MKINGRVSEINTDILVLPRKDGDIVFKFAAVLDEDEFEKLCPVPKAPRVFKKDDKVGRPDFEDKDYVQQMEKHNNNYAAWLTIKTMSPTENLTWDFVKLENPDTWCKVDEELKAFGINPAERRLINQKIMEVNTLSSAAIERAKLRFFDQQAAQAKAMSSQKVAPSIT